jgi:hypothetical protein
MKTVKLNFKALRVPLKIQKAKNIVSKMTGNANFTTPNPALDVVMNAINKLEISYAASLDGGISKTALMRTDTATLDLLIAQLMNYVQDVTGGNELKILSSGMEVKATATAPQPMPAPLNMKYLTDSNDGEANIKWSPVKGSKAYLIQSSTTPDVETSWAFFDACTSANYTALGLTSHTAIWFRIAALGAKGAGPWSDPLKASIK